MNQMVTKWIRQFDVQSFRFFIELTTLWTSKRNWTYRNREVNWTTPTKLHHSMRRLRILTQYCSCGRFKKWTRRRFMNGSPLFGWSTLLCLHKSPHTIMNNWRWRNFSVEDDNSCHMKGETLCQVYMDTSWYYCVRNKRPDNDWRLE